MRSEASNGSSNAVASNKGCRRKCCQKIKQKDYELLNTLQKIQVESQHQNSLGDDKKYPGVTFLHSGIKDGEILVNLYSISEKQQKKIEEQKQLRNYLRNKRRHTRRLKEKIFRHNLKKAFNVKNAKIIEHDDLKEKVNFEILKKKGRFSTFPINFNIWKNPKSKKKSKLNQALKRKNEVTELEDSGLVETLRKSKDLNEEGVDCVSKLLFSLKEMKKNNLLDI